MIDCVGSEGKNWIQDNIQVHDYKITRQKENEYSLEKVTRITAMEKYKCGC